MPLLSGSGAIDHRALFWHFPIYLQSYSKDNDNAHDTHFRTRPGSAMRFGKWKLHEYFEDGRLELYDLSTDVSERHNLAAEKPDKTSELHAMLKQWREDLGCPVPTKLNPAYRGK